MMRFSIAALAAGLVLGATQAGAEVKMRISHPVPTAHHMHKALVLFAEDVKQRTKGGVDVQIFPAEQLAKTAENFPQVARGAIEAAAVVNVQWGNTIPEMAGPTIPSTALPVSFWNCFTASAVFGPKIPSAVIE